MPSSASAVKDGKVIVNFKHTGDAPILRTTKFKVPADAPFQTVTALLRKALGLQAQDPLVCARPQHRVPTAALCSHAANVGSSSTATAPLRRPRTSSSPTSPSASTWRACSCSTTASPQRGADANGRLERRASSQPAAAAGQGRIIMADAWRGEAARRAFHKLRSSSTSRLPNRVRHQLAGTTPTTRCPSARGEAHRCLQGGWLHSKVDRSTGP